MMVETVPFREIPLFHQNPFFLDFVDGKDSALQFFQHPPMHYLEALEKRKSIPYNRKQAADSLYELNVALNADQKALENIETLRDSNTFCVITGQQVGFFMGPAYTTYKILTAIQLAMQLTAESNMRFIPVFWGASEDHDFHEINHIHFQKNDGEIGKISFSWSNIGNSIYDLPLTEEIRTKAETYIEQLSRKITHSDEMSDYFRPRNENNFVQWTYSIITRLFSRYGLVIADPRILRPYMGGFLQKLHDRRASIKAELQLGAEDIRSAGYEPPLDPAKVGGLFTYGDGGVRVRLDDSMEEVSSLKDNPEHYSPDVTLRPLLADKALPIGVNVLGPNEIYYSAQLHRLYALFELPQPVVFPRKSYTIVSRTEIDRLLSYGLSIRDLLIKTQNIRDIYKNLGDEELTSRFEKAKTDVAEMLFPLKEYVMNIDPNLSKTWERTLENIKFRIAKLEDRTTAALLSRSGYTKQELQAQKNLIIPKGRLQERILPFSHFIGVFGYKVLNEILDSTSPTDFSHEIISID